MELIWIVPVAGIAGVLFAVWLAWDVLRRDTGTDLMRDVASMIFEGANAFMRRQYTTIAMLAVVVAVAVGALVGYFDEDLETGVLAGFAFIVGASCSALSGFIGMYIAVRSNVRTASAATRSLREAIMVSLRGGAVSGFLIVALSLLGVAGIFGVYSRLLDNPIDKTPFLIVGFGFGASFVALFAQLGGGIYTKAADMGADLVGKIEAGIPEDDPRNAAVVADLVGDNVGDCAGRGADLFESTAAENIGAMILGVAIFVATGNEEWIMFPLVVRAFGLIATIVGVSAVPFFTREDQNPMTPLNYAYWVIVGLSTGFMALVTYVMMDDEWGWFFAAGVVGILTSVAFVYITQYYTSGSWRPVKEIVEASRTGPATNIVMGTAVGLETTAVTALVIGSALVASFVLGDQSGLPNGGVYGTAVATMGMLMSAAYVLAMDTFGPITDNANGIIEMSGAPGNARQITESLDAVGNTTKALTKGFAMGSAGLAAFLLFSAFLDKVKEKLIETGQPLPDGTVIRSLTDPLPVDLSGVGVFVAALLGVMLVFLFSSLAIRSVAHAAAAIIEEVRRQFRENPGIMAGTERPDYGRAVDITTRAALRGMVGPGILAVGMPVAVGLVFRGVHEAGWLVDTGPQTVAGMLMVATIGGIILATFFNNVGGAWDNAKKYIEAGLLKVPASNPGNPALEMEVLGKGSDAHKAAVVGDTVGDPFKDTAGPSLHVLVKLLSTVTLVLAPLFIS
ncbi:MAG: sodium-translocating pyrophosphatase [Chloroflexi bacterium]|nr:sodium-translocating pyrophosphatase [Chloroflexota bacterium]